MTHDADALNRCREYLGDHTFEWLVERICCDLRNPTMAMRVEDQLRDFMGITGYPAKVLIGYCWKQIL